MLSEYFDELRDTLDHIPYAEIKKAVEVLGNARRLHRRVWIAGNGGSATTSSHFACDLQKCCKIDVVSLPDMVASTLAFGNDQGWSNMFLGPMDRHFKGDIFIGISYSGRSDNVIKAARYAMVNNGTVIVMTGSKNQGNFLSQIDGIVIAVDSNNIRVVEDVHLAICHSMIGEIDAMSGLLPSLQEGRM